MSEQGQPTDPAWTQRRGPEQLTLIQEFVNTHAYGIYPEQLASPVSSRKWFRQHGIVIRQHNDQTLAEIIDLRETLRSVLLGHAAHNDPAAASRRLQKVLQTASIRIRIDETGNAELGEHGSGVQRFTNKIAGAILTSSIDGTWQRLKVCGNDECRVAFYDHSRNSTTRYCSTAICANRVRQRNFRQRTELTPAT
jgi:predicted RNA-binding Zn ribbon-like protein